MPHDSLALLAGLFLVVGGLYASVGHAGASGYLAVMALVMAYRSGRFQHHLAQFFMIWGEWTTIRDPRKLSEIAAERKPRMQLLPYGIPICIGSIAYFLWAGMV